MGKDDRLWLRIDRGFWEHPKSIRAGRDGRDLFLVGLAWSASQLTDGVIPEEVLGLLAFKVGISVEEASAAKDRLIEVGMWHEMSPGDNRGTAWNVHDFELHQSTRAEVEGQRKKWREKKARQRDNNAELAQPPELSPPMSPGVSPPLSPDKEKEKEKEKENDIAAYEIAETIASQWASYSGQDAPRVTAASVKSVRLLLDRGPTTWARARKVPEAEVRAMVDLVFTKGTDRRGDFCWADQVRSGNALRRHWVQLLAFKSRCSNGQGHRTVSVGNGLAANGPDSRAQADLDEAMAFNQRMKESEQ